MFTLLQAARVGDVHTVAGSACCGL